MDRFRDKERQTISHVAFLAVLTLLGILLAVVALYSHWDTFIIPLVIAVLIVVWIMHFFSIGSNTFRIYFYTCCAVFALYFYGLQDETITDIPIIICLLIISLSFVNDMRLIYLAVLPFPSLILYQIFVTHYLSFATEQIVISRLVLGTVAITAAIILARSILASRLEDAQDNENLRLELENSIKNTENFLANVSHELRTPINAINGLSDLMLSADLPEEIKDEAESIKYAGLRINNQVSNMLYYSEIVTDSMRVVERNYEISSVVSDALSNIMWDDYGKKLQVAIDIDATIPSVLFGDDIKIKKIIYELIDNALKFTESGGVYFYISKRDESYGINLNIDVYDTGAGLSDSEIISIYNGFYKKDSSSSRTTDGLGLGLNVVHAMTAAMKGFLNIDSEIGRGSHFHVSIPQRIINKTPSITVNNSDQYCIGCYLNAEKYDDNRIAAYYKNIMNHFRSGTGVNILQAQTIDEFREIVRYNELTHIFISQWEYDVYREYFDELSKSRYVFVITNSPAEEFTNNRLTILGKPLTILNIVNILAETMPGAHNSQRADELADYSSLKVLAVDDDEMNLMVARGVLGKFGISVHTAASGREAIDKCSLVSYDLIFMDHMMPEMDGIEAMRQIRTLRGGYYKNVPIIVLTANAGSNARNMFMEKGFDEFIAKPIEITAMSRILKEFAGGYNE